MLTNRFWVSGFAAQFRSDGLGVFGLRVGCLTWRFGPGSSVPYLVRSSLWSPRIVEAYCVGFQCEMLPGHHQQYVK